MRRITPILLALVFASAGCGGTATTETTASTPPAATTPGAPASTPPPGTTAPPTNAAPAKTLVPKAVLPDVVGMNLQAAQDTMQAAGFYLLNDKDATGQNRLQVFDRNWVVSRQTPAAGKRVSPATLITLWAKKYGE